MVECEEAIEMHKCKETRKRLCKSSKQRNRGQKGDIAPLDWQSGNPPVETRQLTTRTFHISIQEIPNCVCSPIFSTRAETPNEKMQKIKSSVPQTMLTYYFNKKKVIEWIKIADLDLWARQQISTWKYQKNESIMKLQESHCDFLLIIRNRKLRPPWHLALFLKQCLLETLKMGSKYASKWLGIQRHDLVRWAIQWNFYVLKISSKLVCLGRTHDDFVN